MSTTRPTKASPARARPGAARLHGDAGQVGGIEVLPFGLLLFVIGALLITNAWAVIDAKLAVDGAAREAARALAEAPDEPAGRAAAEHAADAALQASGRADGAVVRVEAPFGFARCAPVAVTVTVRVPSLHLPWVGGLGGGFDVSQHHAAMVDPHRSGVPGEAWC